MIREQAIARYLAPLLRGDRQACRKVVEETLQSGITANAVYLHMIWPVTVEIENLFRQDKISPTQEHLATRINRTIIDQLQNKLPRRPEKGKRVAICCAHEEIQELGAQMIADLFESDGWEVRFLGGGLTNDDIYGFVNDYAPDVLTVYGTAPKQAPQVRQLIDKIKSVNAWPNLRILVSGGLFGRAEGLWEEIGADAYAANPGDAVFAASEEGASQIVAQPTINRRKRRKTKVTKTQTQEVSSEAVPTS
ncbi:B12-binding domain-containing protein [Planctomycetota bacterium]